MKNFTRSICHLFQMCILLSALLLCLPASATKTFVHPGLSHKQSDLDRMKAMVQAKIDPYYSSYLKLKSNSLASYDYSIKGAKGIDSLAETDLDGKFGSDSRAAYMNALMWCITGDKRHAQKAVDIFNTYSSLTYVNAGATAGLNSSKCYLIIEAAELIQSTYSGWASSDIQKFKDMLVYPGYSTSAVPSGKTTFYWNLYRFDSGRHGNQELLPMRACLAMGVLLNNEVMYDRAIRYFKGETHRSDDLAYDSGPGVALTVKSTNDYFINYNYQRDTTTADYGFNGVLRNYIWENGQCQESSRDQDHAVLGMGVCAALAEMAWNQGDDVYSLHNNRILKGYEFAAKYNVSYTHSYDDQTSSWEPTVASGEFIQRMDRTGRWKSLKVNPHYESDFVSISRGHYYSDKRPIWEIPLAHYGIRMGLPSYSLKWTTRAHETSTDSVGVEQSGWTTDHLGWGGLTAHRPDSCAGEACSFANGKPVFALHFIPQVVQAEDYDYFSADGQAHTYFKQSTDSTANSYRPEKAVTLVSDSTHWLVTNMQGGEWLTYTVGVPLSGTYLVSVNYKSTKNTGKLRITFGSNQATTQQAIPLASALTDYTLYQQVALEAGVQVMKVFVGGESNVISLNSIQVKSNMSGNKSITLSATNDSLAATLHWSIENWAPLTEKVYRSTDSIFSHASLVETLSSGFSYIDNSIDSQTSYYYWIQASDGSTTLLSNGVKIYSAADRVGHINDIFSTDVLDWVAATTGASLSISNNRMVVSMSKQTSGSYRGDIKRSTGATLHAGKFPILAIKMERPTTVNITLDTNRGSFGGGANKWTGIVNSNVLYYDLTQGSFVYQSTSTTLSTTAATTLSIFQFKVADVTSGKTSYTVDWVKTFASLSELKTFISSSSSTETKGVTAGFQYYQEKNALYLSGVSGSFEATVYSLQGQLLKTGSYPEGTTSIQLPTTKGIYIVKIKQHDSTIKTAKVSI